MHLKSYPNLVRSELRFDPTGVQMSFQRSSLFVNQQGALLRTCNSNHGNIGSSRLTVISSNMLFYQTAAEEGDMPLDIWAVIKPGHVREKIAIFASEQTDAVRGGGQTSTNNSSSQDWVPANVLNTPTSGLLRAVKAKGSWEETCNAKRRRKSGSNQNFQQDQRTLLSETQQAFYTASLSQSESTHRSGGGWCEGEAAEEDQKVSVGEMVAFLEQRASEQQPNSKPVLALQRSSTTITISRAPPPEVRGEEPESVRVSDMVAKLESECLRRTEGNLSRSNSLRRTVGRVLLAAGDQCSAPCLPSSSSVTSSSSSTTMRRDQRPNRTESLMDQAMPPSPDLFPPPSCPSGNGKVKEKGQATDTLMSLHEEVEPLPGLLFLCAPSAASPTQTHPYTDLNLPHLDYRVTLDLVAVPAPSPCLPLDSTSYFVKWKADGLSPGSTVVPLARRASVSQEFLEMRQRLQQLLEPQPYLSVLPHHLLIKIFLLLPTQSLAALKCTCHYFKFLIENYGVRPADSRWVSDPRYRDDPCKQCKKRYGRGDVSLCRWHHKPYCQAQPYGPGYWMCCHSAHRDAPGCNVGLHDNRWVLAFHSINIPITIYRRSCEED